MRTVFVLLDSLNRKAMEPYGGTQVSTPNFQRFARRAVTFDNHYVGSLPCIPARRDLHTGRINFLHRSWGPLEPFDDSFPELLRQSGVYTHIVTDHHHYFADGGATYHQRFSSWELVRGQAIDRWKAHVNPDRERLERDHHPIQRHRLNYMINREYMTREEDYCGPQVFSLATDFLRTNHTQDDWLLQLECFDPHEPFHAPPRFREMYPTSYEGPILDWPVYKRVTESPEDIAELRANYAALTTMCDEYFGRLLDFFDEHDMWRDTCLVLTTDHGFLLGEHGQWMKTTLFEQATRVPLIIRAPGVSQAGQMSPRTVELLDLYPTLLDLAGLPVNTRNEGLSLSSLLSDPDDPRWHKPALSQIAGGRSVRTERYRYTEWQNGERGRALYEYASDPLEHHNLADDPRYAGVVELMRAMLPPAPAERRADPIHYSRERGCLMRPAGVPDNPQTRSIFCPVIDD